MNYKKILITSMAALSSIAIFMSFSTKEKTAVAETDKTEKYASSIELQQKEEEYMLNEKNKISLDKSIEKTKERVLSLNLRDEDKKEYISQLDTITERKQIGDIIRSAGSKAKEKDLQDLVDNAELKVKQAEENQTKENVEIAKNEVNKITNQEIKSNLNNRLELVLNAIKQKELEAQQAEENKKAAEQAQAETTNNTQTSSTQSTTTSQNSTGSVVLSNGNTAGSIGVYAAQKMAATTGVPASTWEYIIARESGGNPNAQNPSGASGLFQTMPFWGSTATVEDQINTALRAYNEALRVFGNGLQPWGM